MPGITSIPKMTEVNRAAEAAMKNISKQLEKFPKEAPKKNFFTELQPLKKPASAADAFPGIYNNPVFFAPRTVEAEQKLSVSQAISQYGAF